MRFIVYLIAILMVGTAVAQNPTILQGNYISNVFGQSNFIKNPNAQTNTANVTVSSATVTRSTTTPLVATSEFNITTSTSTGYADWSTRTFDAGMKNQNCEARFTYRGFSVGSTTVQIRQGSNTVAQLTLTPSTDPRIASINFPCGDLSAATTLRVQQATASLTGTNEIGGIYVGLATNQANVAQAETVFFGQVPSSVAINPGRTNLNFSNEYVDTLNQYDSLTGIFTAKTAGNYFVSTQGLIGPTSWSVNQVVYYGITKSGNAAGRERSETQAAFGGYFPVRINQTVTMGVGDTLQIYVETGATTGYYVDANYGYLTIQRFPTSSELVVTPERQNTFAGVKLQGAGSSNTISTNSWAKFTSSSTLTRTAFGKAKVESNNDHSITIENMPVGNYHISYTGLMAAANAGSGSTTYCRFALADSATGGWQIAGAQVVTTGDATSVNQENNGQTIGGIYNNTSVGTRTFFLQGQRQNGSGNCFVWTDSTSGSTISVIPLDQPSNSALYVQGPVKAAATGATIGAGYVGEKVTWASAPSDYTFTTTEADWTNASITLNPGVWYISAQINIVAITGTTAGNDGECHVKLTDSANNVVNNQSRSKRVRTPAAAAMVNTDVLPLSTTVSISSQTTYKIRFKRQDNNGTNGCTAYYQANNYSDFYAIRLN